MSYVKRKSYRLRFTSEQLKLVQEALLNHVKNLERSWNTSEGSLKAYEKLLSAKKLCLNIQLILEGTRKTGRRCNYLPWKHELKAVR
jgi:hypothetical protein